MNRWTGTGHLTKDPKFLETESGTAICTLRIAVKRAGKQGHDGYFDVKCFDAQANACAQYLKAGREIAVDGRLLFDEFQTQDGAYASRVYIVAERVEFLASRKPSNGQASDDASPDKPATDGAARGGPPGRLTTIPGPRRSTGRGPDDFHANAMTTTNTTETSSRHDTVTRFLVALLGPASRGELIELRYRLDDGQRMGQVFDRRDRVRGIATRAIMLGRRTDVYVGCAPRTRRHGGRDAVERAFVLWVDCDGEHAVDSLRTFDPQPSIVIASGTRQQLSRLLAADRAAAARRCRAREPAARARARRRPRVCRRGADPEGSVDLVAQASASDHSRRAPP